MNLIERLTEISDSNIIRDLDSLSSFINELGKLKDFIDYVGMVKDNNYKETLIAVCIATKRVDAKPLIDKYILSDSYARVCLKAGSLLMFHDKLKDVKNYLGELETAFKSKGEPQC